MPSTFIRRRLGKSGALSYQVLYRAGGRDSRLLSAGTFSALPAAEREAVNVRERLSGCVDGRNYEGDVERVYFARLGDLIKIGISVDPAQRVRDLNAELLLILEGGRRLERELHQKFHALRVSGEWFRARREILGYVQRMTANQAAHVEIEGAA